MNKPAVFVLMPFENELQEVYEHLIRQPLGDIGYTVTRADDIRSQGNILADIVQAIIKSDLIVADLTGANPNVYYETGIAHALQKKVILLTQDIGELPFDLRSYRVIEYDTHFARMSQAKDELKDFAERALKGSLPFGNPVRDFGNIERVSPPGVGDNTDSEPEEELGLFDYRVMLEEGFEEMNEIVKKMASKMNEEVTPEILKTVENLNSGKYNTKQQRNIIRSLASHLQRYGVFVSGNNDRYRVLLVNMETAFENMLSGQFELRDEDAKAELEHFLEVMENLETSARKGRKVFVSLIDTMEALPKIEKTFNRSKTFMAAELKAFVGNIDQTIAIVGRASVLGKGLLD